MLQELEGQFIDPEGTLFKRDWFAVAERHPPIVAAVRAWDFASTEGGGDWSVGVLMGRDAASGVWILDVRRIQGSPQQVQTLVKATAAADGVAIPVWAEQECGSAGVTVIDHYRRLLAGYTFRGERSTGSKVDRAAPLAAMAEGGLVRLQRADWNNDYLDEVEEFPSAGHDDQVDATTLAFSKLVKAPAPAVGGGPILLTPRQDTVWRCRAVPQHPPGLLARGPMESGLFHAASDPRPAPHPRPRAPAVARRVWRVVNGGPPVARLALTRRSRRRRARPALSSRGTTRPSSAK